MFSTKLDDIIDLVDTFDPSEYGRSRNFIDGNVSRLSPYISRGVISTRFVYNRLIGRGFDPQKIEKYIQELTWRDYWQQIWVHKGKTIDEDLKTSQLDVNNYGISKNIIDAQTGIDAIDNAILEFYKTGYLHNHLRMYLAAMACNIGKSHWTVPARWMYYHLFDADWASNALSWQWVAGTNSNKKYYANQDNINKYCYGTQKHTFLDHPYEELISMEVPAELKETVNLKLSTVLPAEHSIDLVPGKPTIIYNFYNLDPFWKNDIKANRVLLLEPSHFSSYPVSEKSINFLLDLSKNIEGLQLYTGEFSELKKEISTGKIYYKEHPLNTHYSGIEESRDWMSEISGYFPSFFVFWKKVKKDLLSKN